MSHDAFSSEWLKRFTDPYALLGVSVAVDGRRLLKRYRTVAKQLHPDALVDKSSEQRQFADQILPKLVNPAYQRLKQDKGRNEVLATLRFKVRRLSREQKLQPTGEKGKQLLNVPEPEIDIFYEHAVEQLCDRQYASLADFEANTRQLSELNLVYLRRKMGAPVIREKRTGLVASATVAKSPASLADPPSDGKSSSGLAYAERYIGRAQEYLKAKNTEAAIPELKDALRIDPQNSAYHCLIAQAYLLHKLPGMAKVHFKQALKLNPENVVALKYAKQLNITVTEAPRPTGKAASTAAKGDRRSLFGNLFSKGPTR
ncbi:DnaJ domain-containing protein [Nodosilinea sp. LEGE 07088]|uniref:DnaJ domain-containing protein n=1 Tax=Nodosilinea sp. LEGE 07088 TaxID=2777968 RepID=UPI001880864C|nr:DnaJ domain-containing protein [Nodosilinea sp. LEGE 07088]MBE9136996.1 DnaJ domain-containing protein [Nodosilinea sp. LEGE 07088]